MKRADTKLQRLRESLSMQEIVILEKMLKAILVQTKVTSELISYARLGKTLGLTWVPKRFTAFLKRAEECCGSAGCLVEREPRQGVSGLTTLGIAIQAKLEPIVSALEVVENEQRRQVKPKLRIAASTALNTYLCPYFLENLRRVYGERLDVEIQEFSPKTTPNLLLSGEIDLAIIWNGYKLDPVMNGLQSIRFPETSTSIHAIFHPLHPFAKWLRSDRFQGKMPESKLLIEQLSKHPIIFPKLALMRRVAMSLEGSGGLIQLEGWPSVVNHVQLRLGVGLWPGWDWLKRHVGSDILQSIELPETVVERELYVIALRRKARESKDGETIQELITMIQKTFSELSLCDDWEIVRLELIQNETGHDEQRELSRMILNCKDWSGLYVSPGTEGMPIPHWRWFGIQTEYKDQPQTKQNSKQQSRIRRRNTNEVGEQIRETIILPTTIGATVALRSYRKQEGIMSPCTICYSTERVMIDVPASESVSPAISCFYHRLIRKETPAAIILCGFVQIASKSPTLSPILISTSNLVLKPQDYRQIRDLLTIHSRMESLVPLSPTHPTSHAE